MHVQNCCCANINLLIFLLFSLLSSLIKLPINVIQKFCCHGNVTSHLSSLQKRQENACQRFFNKLSYEHMSVHRLHIHRYTHIFSSYQRHIHTGHARCTGLRHTYHPLENKRKKNYKEGKSKLSLGKCFATPSVVGPDNWTCEILNESECYNNNLRKAW